METKCGSCQVCRASLPLDDAECAACGHGQWFRLQDAGGAVILTLTSRMRPERAAIDRIGGFVIDNRTSPHIIVNLALVRFVSSTFVNRHAVLLKKVNAAQGKLTLCGVSPAIRDVLRLMNLERLFELAGSNGSEAVAV